MLRGSETRRSADGEAALAFDGQVSRRSLLSKAGAAAVAAVAAGTLLSPRQAKAETTFFDTVQAHKVQVVTWGVKSYGVPIGVHGQADATGQAAVYGEQLDQDPAGGGPGVLGDGKGAPHAGVHGRNNAGAGVRGDGGTGVWGIGSHLRQAGVKGEGHTGVWGLSSTNDYSGVYGEHTGTTGNGTTGIGKGAFGAGVLGRNDAGYGGQFEGGKAQLKLKPGATVGKPPLLTQHTKSEIYMDKAGTLFVCVASSTDADPAKWKKVSTVAV